MKMVASNLGRNFRNRTSREKMTSKGRARLPQAAEKVTLAVDFGWRSGLPLRSLHCFECDLRLPGEKLARSESGQRANSSTVSM
jgi:hypothetical protein